VVDPEQMQTTRFPAGACDMSAAWWPHPRVGRYPGWRNDPGDLPESASLQWCVRKS